MNERFITVSEVINQVKDCKNAGYAMITAVVYTAPILKRTSENKTV